MNGESPCLEYIRIDQEASKIISELEMKYPFFKFSNYIQKWNKLLKHYLSPENMGIRETFLKDYEKAIRIFSYFCLCSKPMSISTVKNCRVFVVSGRGYGTFKGWVRTVSGSNNDYVIVKFDDFSEIVHKDNLFEIHEVI